MTKKAWDLGHSNKISNMVRRNKLFLVRHESDTAIQDRGSGARQEPRLPHKA